VYSFNPIPVGLEKEFEQYILGGEVNMWTEHVPNDSVLDSKVFPRLIALAEVLWSGPGGDYNDFYNRLQSHYPILENMSVKYGLEAEPVSVKSIRKNDSTFLVLTPGGSNLELEFSLCRSVNQLYTIPIYLACSGSLWVQALKEGSYYGDSVSIPITNHLALGKELKYTTNYSTYYPAGGALGLVDGLSGSIDFRDGRWQGISGNDLNVVIDLGKELSVNNISMNFYEYPNAWILLPKSVSVLVSTDGDTWQTLSGEMIGSNPQAHAGEKQVFPVSISNSATLTVRYIKVVATNYGKLPEWHEAAGSESWLFVDEIIVR
jgi:hexosaminidase